MYILPQYKNNEAGTSLVVQGLRLRASTAGAWVQSLVGELRSHMLCGSAKTNKQKKQADGAKKK